MISRLFPLPKFPSSRLVLPLSLFPGRACFADLHFNLSNASSAGGIEAVLGGDFIPDWRGDGGSVWNAFRRTCPPNAQARRLFGSVRNPLRQDQVIVNHLAAAGVAPPASNEDFNFPVGVDDRYNYCDHPWAHMDQGEQRQERKRDQYARADHVPSILSSRFQGHFFSDWRTINALYPMFSPAKGLGFSDILIPSHYYHQVSLGLGFARRINLALTGSSAALLSVEQEVHVRLGPRQHAHQGG